MSFQYSTPITPSTIRIGWIGTGVMGSAMATRLLSAGYSVSIYARSPWKAEVLISQGAHLADGPAVLAASCDIIFTMLGHPSDVRQIVLSKDTGLLSAPLVKTNAVFIDHTSSHPDLAKEIHEFAREKSCWAVDAPVSGGDTGARTGKLSIFAGGDKDVVDWLAPLLNIIGSKVTYMGVAGSGQRCKIANQIVVGGNALGLSEGLMFAEQVGLGKCEWIEAVRGGAAGSMAMELWGKRIIDRDFEPGGFAEYMVKDLGMGVDVEGEANEESFVVLPGAALCKQLYSGMLANGDGKMGGQALITVLERINSKKGEI